MLFLKAILILKGFVIQATLFRVFMQAFASKMRTCLLQILHKKPG